MLGGKSYGLGVTYEEDLLDLVTDDAENALILVFQDI